MACSPFTRSIFVGTATLIGCGVALFSLYDVMIAEVLGGLQAILSIFSPNDPKQQGMLWLPLLLAGVAVATAIAINAWSLWWSKPKPQGGHLVFQMVTFACSAVTLAFTLYFSGSVILLKNPDFLDDPFGTKAAIRKREEDEAYAAEMAQEEARRRENEAHNAEAERLEVLRNQKSSVKPLNQK